MPFAIPAFVIDALVGKALVTIATALLRSAWGL